MKQVTLTFTQLLLGVDFMPTDICWQIVLRMIELALDPRLNPNARCFAFFYKNADLSGYPVTSFIPPKRYVYCKSHEDLCEGRVVVSQFPDLAYSGDFVFPPDEDRRSPADPLPGVLDFVKCAIADRLFERVYEPNGTFSKPVRALALVYRKFRKSVN